MSDSTSCIINHVINIVIEQVGYKIDFLVSLKTIPVQEMHNLGCRWTRVGLTPSSKHNPKLVHKANS